MPEASAVGEADQWGERMPRSVGLVDSIAVLVGVTIGSGIFRVPATVAAQLHTPGAVLLCWVLGGVFALSGALTIAEQCRAPEESSRGCWKASGPCRHSCSGGVSLPSSGRRPSAPHRLATALGVFYVLQNTFAELADKFVLGLWPFYSLAVAGVFVLRRKRPDLPRPYRVWGYPWVPLVFLTASLGMVANALWTEPWKTGVTLLIIMAGVPLFYLWKRLTRG